MKIDSIKTREVLHMAGLPLGHGLVDWFGSGFSVLLPKISAAMGLSSAQAGLIISVSHFSGAVSSPFLGLFSDVVGRRAPLMALMVAWVALGYLVASLSPSYLWLVVLVGVAELGSVAWHPPAMAILAERFLQNRGLAMSVHSLGGVVAGALAPISMGFLLVHLSWQSTVQVIAVPILLSAFVIWLLLRRLRGVVVQATPVRELVRQLNIMSLNPSLFGILFLAGSNAMVRNALITMLPLYLAQSLKMNIGLVGVHIGTLTLSGVAAAPLMGILSDRYGRKPVLTLAMAFAGLSIVALSRQTPRLALF